MNSVILFFTNIDSNGWMGFFGSGLGVVGAYYVASNFYKKQALDKSTTIFILAKGDIDSVIIMAEQALNDDFLYSASISRKEEYYDYFSDNYRLIKKRLKPEEMNVLVAIHMKELLQELELVDLSMGVICDIKSADLHDDRVKLEISEESIRKNILTIRMKVNEILKIINIKN